MSNELQPRQKNGDGRASLPALNSPVLVDDDETKQLAEEEERPPFDLQRRALYFGMGFLPATAVLTYMTQGQLGESAVLGAVLGSSLAYFEPELQKVFSPGLRVARQLWTYMNRNHSGRAAHRLLDKDWWLGYERGPYADEDGDEEPDDDLEDAELDDEEEEPEEQAAAGGRKIPGLFTLGPQSIAAIQEANADEKVYFGSTTTGAVVLPIADMYHVMDMAPSGKGKSNRFRLAMMQVVNLADTYYINPLANNVKVVKDARKIEVWKPIFDCLANKRPMKEGKDIREVLGFLVAEIQKRSEQEERYDFSWAEHPIFVFVDELPEVFARFSGAGALLDRICRTGRQFHVFCWLATQTAQVSDIGLSTPSQAQLKTRIYGGGDKTSADRLMKGLVTRDDEKILQTSGPGLTLMLADGFSNSEFVRAPLVTNEMLFAYFGLPPFRKEDWLATPQNESPAAAPNVIPFTLSPSAPNQAQNERESSRESSRESERRERVKAPNEGVILEALEALDREEKALTLNAVAKRAGLTWRQYDEIEDVAAWSGFELDRGKGRPAKEG